MNTEKADSHLFDPRDQRLSASHLSVQRVIDHYKMDEKGTEKEEETEQEK